MARVLFIRGVVIPIALFCGLLSLAWNAAITKRLSSTLPDREAWLPSFSNVVRQNQFHEQRTTTHTETNPSDSYDGEPFETSETLPTNVYDSTRLVANANDDNQYFPIIVNIDGSAASNITAKKPRRIHIDRSELRAWKEIEDDKNYPNVEVASREECVPMASWQSESNPNCNFVHEVGLHTKALNNEFYYVASGGSNDVFRVIDNNMQSYQKGENPDLALKLLSPSHKHLLGIPPTKAYSRQNYDIVRRDALVAERLTKSSQILDIHGYCGFSVMVPFADGGTLGSALANEWTRGVKKWTNMTSDIRLRFAIDAAKGLADIHELGVVHGDLTVRQYLNRNGRLQLHDFNQGIYLQRNSTADDTACTFDIPIHYGTTRGPEEYKKEPQTSAVDVWTLGSIIYHLLTGRKVWYRHKKHEAKEAVIDGKLPDIDQQILDSPDPVEQVLKNALDRCFVYDPSQRGTAREVASLLEKGLEEIGQ